jgi:D-inositol-3-phosphate glycosyltransferase
MADSEKIRLSIIADAGAPTGFATVTHNIARHLQNSGEYEINILGVNYHGKPNQWSKEFNIFPANLGGDFLGLGYAKEFVMETKPDVLFLFQDFWNITYYAAAVGAVPGMVCYYPVDAPNIKGKFMAGISAASEVCTYTKFGAVESVRAAREAWAGILDASKEADIHVAKLMKVDIEGLHDPASGKSIGGGSINCSVRNLKKLMALNTYNIVPHGVDTSAFYPMEKKEVRKKFGIPDEAFIVGNINRNQSRKRQDLSIKAFSQFAKGKDDVFLVLHSVRDDGKGWDLDQLADYYGVQGRVLLTHKLFDKRTATIEQLNELMNCVDVSINTGGGEGWGLTAHESAACHIPQIVPDWSATKEIWEGAGLLIKVVEVRHEPSQINTAQAVISVPHLVEMLNELYEDRALLDKIGEQCYNVTQRPEYQWSNIAKQFDTIFKRAYRAVPDSSPIALSAKGIAELKKMQQKESSVNPQNRKK